MKFTTKLSFLAAILGLANAHYTFPDFILTGDVITSDWEYVRETANHYSQGPVTDVTDQSIRCYELDYNATPPATSIVTVSAGDTVGFQADGPIYHPGYYSAYLSPASPSADSPSAGLGQTWFKIWEDPPVYTPGTGLTFPSQTQTQFTFTIPKDTPSGQYLLRGEQIGLHIASSAEGAQFYLGCAQINIINGGTGTPGPLVSFPGAYSATDPGILIDIYNIPANFPGYQSPGPAVWTGGSGGSSPPPSSSSHSSSTSSKASSSSKTSSTSSKSTSTTSTKPTTTSTSTKSSSTKASSTSSAPSGSQTLYGQCGGQGWTGPTTCAQGTCKVSSIYYSQCLTS